MGEHGAVETMTTEIAIVPVGLTGALADDE